MPARLETDLDREELVRELTEAIIRSPKYKHSDILEATIVDLVAQETTHHSTRTEILDASRRKLHNIVAAYLGNPDYDKAQDMLDVAFSAGSQEEVKSACIGILSAHVSTRERLPILEKLYTEIFKITGRPHIILDLACGLHPLSFPWMDLPVSTRYHAYDIQKRRVAFLNHFFLAQGMEDMAEARDVIASPPEVSADIAFIFKEVHRFEQRRRGCSRALLEKIAARWVVISLPAQSMHSKHDFTQSYRTMFYRIIEGSPWPVQELTLADEIFFIISKENK
jgi:16S rRNA (guanine(1405)-N(7))-methyltransferase